MQLSSRALAWLALGPGSHPQHCQNKKTKQNKQTKQNPKTDKNKQAPTSKKKLKIPKLPSTRDHYYSGTGVFAMICLRPRLALCCLGSPRPQAPGPGWCGFTAPGTGREALATSPTPPSCPSPHLLLWEGSSFPPLPLLQQTAGQAGTSQPGQGQWSQDDQGMELGT